MTIKITQIPSESGKGDTCPECKMARGDTQRAKTQSYEEFFSEEERNEFDQIARDYPDLTSMLPPQSARYRVRSTPNNRTARDRFESKKKKDNMKGEYHHSHPIKVGGCPLHQDLVQKPDDPAAKQKVDECDDKINDVVNKAIKRHTGATP